MKPGKVVNSKRLCVGCVLIICIMKLVPCGFVRSEMIGEEVCPVSLEEEVGERVRTTTPARTEDDR